MCTIVLKKTFQIIKRVLLVLSHMSL